LQESETTASTDEDEILESLIDTFPASDPPAGVALARVGIQNRREPIFDREPPSPGESQFGIANTARQVSN
jgi:hypothetical protein